MQRAVVLSWLVAASFACTDDSGGPTEAPASDGGMDQDQRDAGHRPPPSTMDAGRPARDAGRPDSSEPPPEDAAAPDAAPDPDAAIGHGPLRTHGLEERVTNETCFLNGTPPLAIVEIAHEPAFAQLTAQDAIGLISAPGGLAVIERAGRVRRFASDGDGSDCATVLDLSAVVRADGLRAAAFRPDGAALFASYLPLGDPLRIVVARFDVSASGAVDADSAAVLLSVPLTDAARAGGALAFLFDGTLAVAFGDGGDSEAATDPTQLAGKVARIDVSAASGHAVPPDNPLLANAGARGEIYALGLGAPTSCSVDRIDGRLWCADAGDATRDAIVLVTAGATLRPILSFARKGCGAVVGHVSRDARLPDIQGALVFGDACTSALEAMRFDGSLVRAQGALTALPASLRAFGEDADGRMFAIDAAGALHALVRPATPAPAFPSTVSATGCLDDVATRTPAPALIPFEVRAPLWSDGAHKRRFLVLPGSETIGFTTQEAWQFPAGTIFMKEFLLDDDGDAETPDRIMETRFIVKRSDSAWEGYSYMWDRTGQDAFLLEGAEIGRYPMQSGAVDSSGASTHRHTFPDRAQCLLCHNAAAGRALGLQTGRMNTDHDYDGFVENQLQAMAYVGLFGAELPAAPDALPRFAEPEDESAPLESRARAWLYANCSHCHRPSGPTPVPLDLRFETPLASTNTCGLTPRFAIAQIPDAQIIAPGSAAQSELFFRLARRDPNQMPPIASLITEPVGVDVVQRWIDGLTACP